MEILSHAMVMILDKLIISKKPLDAFWSIILGQIKPDPEIDAQP